MLKSTPTVSKMPSGWRQQQQPEDVSVRKLLQMMEEQRKVEQQRLEEHRKKEQQRLEEQRKEEQQRLEEQRKKEQRDGRNERSK